MQTIADYTFRNHPGVQRGIGRNCLALVWVKDGAAPERFKEVISALRARTDVELAERAPGKANVVMMHFDRNCTSAVQIVLELRRSGVAAVLFDC